MASPREPEDDLESAALEHPLLVHVWLLDKGFTPNSSCEVSLKTLFRDLGFHALDSEHEPVHGQDDCAGAFEDAERPVRKLLRKAPVDGLLILISCAVRLHEEHIFISVDGEELDSPVYTHSENPDWPLLDRLLDNVWGSRMKSFRHLPRVYLINAHSVDGVPAGESEAVRSWDEWCAQLTETFRFPSVERAIVACRTYEEQQDGFHRRMHRNSALLLALGEAGLQAFSDRFQDWFTRLPLEGLRKLLTHWARGCGVRWPLPQDVVRQVQPFASQDPETATLRNFLLDLDDSDAQVTLVQCLLKKKYSISQTLSG